MRREKKERSIKTVEQSKRKSTNEENQNQEPSIQWISSIFACNSAVFSQDKIVFQFSSLDFNSPSVTSATEVLVKWRQ